MLLLLSYFTDKETEAYISIDFFSYYESIDSMGKT